MEKHWLISEYEKVWDGSPWYGENIMSILGGIPLEKITIRCNGSHNLAEIISHMTSWKQYLIDRVKDLKHEDMPDERNFPRLDDVSVDQWSELVRQLIRTHSEFLQLLKNNEVNLSMPVNGSSFNIGNMLSGGLRHDIYHAGQLRFLSKHLTSTNETH